MSVNTMTMDQTPPRRPGIDDVGGGAKENATDLPDPRRGMTAEDWNQVTKQIVAMGLVVPQLRVWVRFSAGTPVLETFAAWNQNIIVGDFTFTDMGAGDTKVIIASAKLASQMGKPSASITAGGAGLARHPEVIATVVATNIEFRVKTGDSTNALADLPFRLDIF